eukprot:403357842
MSLSNNKRHQQAQSQNNAQLVETHLYTDGFNVNRMVMLYDDDNDDVNDYMGFEDEISPIKHYEDSRYYEDNLTQSQKIPQSSSTPNSGLKGAKFANLIGPNEKMIGSKLQSSFKNLHTQNLSKQKTNIKIIPKKGLQVPQTLQNNLILIKNQPLSQTQQQQQLVMSPYQKQLVLNSQHVSAGSGAPGYNIKNRIQSAARATTNTNFTGNKSRRSLLPQGIQSQNISKKRMTEGLGNFTNSAESRTGTVTGFYRETKNRASRFNLDQDEMTVYQSFANILSSFDETSRLELIECILKDSQEIESQQSELL